MTKQKETTQRKRRTQIKDLPKNKQELSKELSKEEQEKLKGGLKGFEPQPIAAAP